MDNCTGEKNVIATRRAILWAMAIGIWMVSPAPSAWATTASSTWPMRATDGFRSSRRRWNLPVGLFPFSEMGPIVPRVGQKVRDRIAWACGLRQVADNRKASIRRHRPTGCPWRSLSRQHDGIPRPIQEVWRQGPLRHAQRSPRPLFRSGASSQRAMLALPARKHQRSVARM